MPTLMLVGLLLFSPMILAQDGDEAGITTYNYTYHRADGNRVVEGTGTFPDVNVFDLELGGIPIWIVGAATTSEALNAPPTWLVILEDGSIQGTFFDADGHLSISSVIPDVLASGMPTVLAVNEMGAFPMQAFPADASTLTHPLYIEDRTLYIAENGDVVLLENDDEIARLALNALPDARIVMDGDRAAIYTGATTDRYVHGIMGDSLEAASLHILNTNDLTVRTEIVLEGDEVFEGISPIWADVDEDGNADLITTVSFGGGGAQLRVYDANDGALMAQSDAIGQSNRWRHQLAWGAFGPNGENELIEVLTPHIGGIVGHFRYDGAGNLQRITRLDGYTSHVINSRNLDMAVAGDFDGDGQPEIALPDQQRGEINGIAHTADGAAVVWMLPLEGTLTSNLSAVALPDGGMGLAAGIVDSDGRGRLRVWLP